MKMLNNKTYYKSKNTTQKKQKKNAFFLIIYKYIYIYKWQYPKRYVNESIVETFIDGGLTLPVDGLLDSTCSIENNDEWAFHSVPTPAIVFHDNNLADISTSFALVPFSLPFIRVLDMVWCIPSPFDVVTCHVKQGYVWFQI